jgi:hypothetical protein
VRDHAQAHNRQKRLSNQDAQWYDHVFMGKWSATDKTESLVVRHNSFLSDRLLASAPSASVWSRRWAESPWCPGHVASVKRLKPGGSSNRPSPCESTNRLGVDGMRHDGGTDGVSPVRSKWKMTMGASSWLPFALWPCIRVSEPSTMKRPMARPRGEKPRPWPSRAHRSRGDALHVRRMRKRPAPSMKGEGRADGGGIPAGGTIMR